MKKIPALGYGIILISFSGYAGVMRHDINVQEYRDFAENMGKYRVGLSNIPIFKKDGELSGYLDFAMPDLSSVSRRGFATLINPSYETTTRHVTALGSVSFGGPSAYSSRYLFINRNQSAVQDNILPRLNKVVTEVAPIDYVERNELQKGHGSRYIAYVRAGAGEMTQVTNDLTEKEFLASAYKWLAGGTINIDTITFNKEKNDDFYWIQYEPGHQYSSALSISTGGGDSGSPIYVYDNVDKKWKLAGVHYGGYGSATPYGRKVISTRFNEEYFNGIIANNISRCH